MKILIADDEPVSCYLLEECLAEWGHEVTACTDGPPALQTLRAVDAPRLAILDWHMPGLDGIDVCRELRAAPPTRPPYLILLTVRQDKESIVAGLDAGANDYVTKPFDPAELRARVNVGIRLVEMQQALAERVRELEDALAHIKRLQGILPICSYCKKVRSDQNYWQQVEGYIAEHSEARFSHAICPECLPRVLEEARRELAAANHRPAP